MDLILLKPGNPEIVGENNFQTGGSLIDNEWRAEGLNIVNSIEIISMHHSMKQQITTDVSNSARTSGRPNITDITCVKYVDKTSTKLYQHLLTAEPIGKGKNTSKIFILRNSGDKTANIMTFELKDAIVSHIEFQSHPDDMPTEQIMLNFTEIIWTYNVQLNDTTSLGNISHGWSIAQNRPIGEITT